LENHQTAFLITSRSRFIPPAHPSLFNQAIYGLDKISQFVTPFVKHSASAAPKHPYFDNNPISNRIS
jgi:hypothetical protein